ncbi:MAG: SDR family oxidoreductase [Planctomycetes bacterium]|nr:SDR family oxidoreductase [Planctomycetota bacterium]
MSGDRRGVLITGGSGAVGRALVRRFVADGCAVAFTWCRNRAAADELAAATGALALAADLTDRAQVAAMVAAALDRLQHVDVLVNNAGRTQVLPFPLIEEEDWDAMMAANLKSLFLVTHEVVRGMIGRKAGAIVNVGSLAGQRLLDVPVHYAAAKAAVGGFTRALARELSRYGVRVNTVVPGLLDDGVGRLVPAKEREDYVRHCAAGRAGRAEEVAEVAAFLASERASYVNGQDVFVDGGI